MTSNKPFKRFFRTKSCFLLLFELSEYYIRFLNETVLYPYHEIDNDSRNENILILQLLGGGIVNISKLSLGCINGSKKLFTNNSVET